MFKYHYSIKITTQSYHSYLLWGPVSKPQMMYLQNFLNFWTFAVQKNKAKSF